MDSLTNSRAATSGLATWRARQAEEKRLKLLELDHYRSYATTEERNGQTFTVVRIPDRYDFTQKPLVMPMMQLRTPKRKNAGY